MDEWRYLFNWWPFPWFSLHWFSCGWPLYNIFSSSCKWSETSSVTVELFRYLWRRPLAWRPLIIITKGNGSNQEPCGTDLFTWSQLLAYVHNINICMSIDGMYSLVCSKLPSSAVEGNGRKSLEHLETFVHVYANVYTLMVWVQGDAWSLDSLIDWKAL